MFSVNFYVNSALRTVLWVDRSGSQLQSCAGEDSQNVCESFFILKNVQMLEKLTYLRVTSFNKSQILVCEQPYG